eukprot:1485170-Pleurochrysis_carterae.AAC.1
MLSPPGAVRHLSALTTRRRAQSFLQRPAHCAVNHTSHHPAPCAISHLSPPGAVRHLSPLCAVRYIPLHHSAPCAVPLHLAPCA